MSAETAQKTETAEDGELYLVDGSGFIFRAYYAMAYGQTRGQELTNPEGTPVGAVYGFTNMLLKMLQDYHAPYIAVVFDAARLNFRNEIYEDYKANRDETPEDLIPQFPLVREATAAFDIPCLELEGYEADDLIATYTKLALEKGKKVVIVSSDKDLMQLVQPGVRMLDPMKGQFIGADEVMAKFGVTPDKVVDVQALAGDSTDNIPGVPGIGVKTAAQLINDYGSLEELLERAGEIKQPKRREALIENAEMARISRQLVKLADDVDVPVKIEELKVRDGAHPNLMGFLQAQGFNSILKRLGAESSSAPPAKAGASKKDSRLRGKSEEALPPPSQNRYTLIDDAKVLKKWVADARARGLLAIDTETTSLTPAKAKLVGISIASTIGIAAYIPLGHVQDTDLFGDSNDDLKQIPLEEAIEILKPLLEDESVLKIGHNMKYDWQMLAGHGVRMNPCDDTMLISYVLDGTAHSHAMDNLAQQYFGHTNVKYAEIVGKGKSQITFDRVPLDKALDYAAEDAEITLRLWKIFKPRIAREKMAAVYENIERPLIPVIAEMELAGIRVDPNVLKDLSKDFGMRLAKLEKEIHKLAGHEFNVASPRQVAGVLFDEMGLQGGRKTKGGDYSTSVGVLEKLADEGHEIVQKILDYRQLAKLKSTYSDALLEEINPETGRVHTSFAIAYVNTGRLASSDPNLQNIPIRTEEGRKIREAFIAEKGHVLLSVDYSQIELRLAAAMAGIEALKQAFRNGTDIHALTASQVFDVPLKDVTPEIRRQAKAVNFGIIYGISGWGLAKQLGCDVSDANEFINRYLAKFSELHEYMEEKKEEAKKNGFVKTLYGRKIVIKGINEKGAQRGFAERQAINAPLQGTAADIMKIAMGRMNRALVKKKLSARMLLQVHDELIFEVPEKELNQTIETVRGVMEGVADIGVPLEAEAGSGRSWAAAH